MQKQPREHARELLSKLDLNDIEIRLYLIGLEQGALPVSVLARLGNITRTNAYAVTKSLVNKGLCSYQGAQYGRKVRFEPVTEVVQLVERKQRELSGVAVDLLQLAPYFATARAITHLAEPKVEFFQGTEGVQKLFYKSSIGSHDSVYSILSESGIFDVLGKEFIVDYSERRSANNIVSYSLRPSADKNITDPSIHNSVQLKRKVRFLPDSINVNTTILLWDKKYVAFITVHEDPFGTLIMSNDIYSTISSFFSMLWEMGS